MKHNNSEKLIRDAQYRKGLSIAYFNSLNAAVELTKAIIAKGNTEDINKNPRIVLDMLYKFRDEFIAEHDDYYARVIANVGVSYSVANAVEKLEAVKSLDELRNVWVGFSEDERRDPKIRETAGEVKKRYEKA